MNIDDWLTDLCISFKRP